MGQTVVAKDFVINRHGRLVFPSNAWPRLDFSVFDTVGQLSAAVSRDFEAKAPSASQIMSRLALEVTHPGTSACVIWGCTRSG
jgi:3-oxoacyl-[acyl-carrier-protein] synthase III